MRGILYLGLLLALLWAAYLMVTQLKAPSVASTPLGKEATLQDLPALAKEKVEKAMELEAQQQEALEKQTGSTGE